MKALLLVIASICMLGEQAFAAARPNVVIFLGDDSGWGDYRVNGNTNQDTIQRPAGESRMKEFRPLTLGVARLEKGRGLLTLRALDIPGRSVMDVRQINLILRP